MSTDLNSAIDHPHAGILLIGHGTRDSNGTSQFFQLTDVLAKLLSPTPVQAALLEFQEPNIHQGWKRLTEKGVKHIHAAPLLLFAAGHAKQDIPSELMECKRLEPGITFDQCRPISRHPAVLELAQNRLNSTLSQINAGMDRTAVVMVGRGSYDPCAQTDMQVLTGLIKHRLQVKQTVTAFYAMANPRLPEMLRQLAEAKQFDAIVIQPHLLFEGRLYQAICKQVATAAKEHPGIQWKVSGYLGPDTLVAQAIAGRIRQASTLNKE